MAHIKKAVAIVCFTALFTTACDQDNTAVDQAAQKQPRVSGYDTLKMGRETFEEKCVVCHGTDGRLGIGGAKVLPDTKLGIDEIKQQVTNGKKAMPSFKQVLTDVEIDAVARYALSLKRDSK